LALVPVDPDVIAALEAVVAREPGNLALGLHLASLLLDAGRADAALEHSRRVLSLAPADRTALDLAGRAAAAADPPGRRPRALRLLPGGREPG
jgi:thioredoxin-like negative regulator of GroEL